MNAFLKCLEWLEGRTGAIGGIKAFMREPIPASVGWRNTLGSLAGALLAMQVLTGFLLALYYVPHPEAAFESLEWVNEHVTLGAFSRALHYWGTSFLIVALFLHMLRVFFSGAYKKPRELNWIVGLLLFGLVFAIAFTGQILPYNQMGFWAAKVGIEIVSSAPLVGDALRRLLTGGDTVGAVTLTRFYALHMVLLPLLLGLLVATHIYLLRKDGITRPASDTSDDTVPFFPLQFTRDMVTISLGLAALAAVALIFKGPHSGPLDLTDTEYLPRPEWYFLAHFEILKWTEGQAQKIFAAFILPNLLLLALAGLPWLDRARTTELRERRFIVSIGTLVAAVIVGLTSFGLLTAPEQAGPELHIAVEEDAEAAEEAADPARAQIALGRRVYRELKCHTCHRVNGRGEIKGPDLSGVGLRLQEEYLRNWLANPQAFIPDVEMPPVKTTEENFEGLIAYLLFLNEQPDL